MIEQIIKINASMKEKTTRIVGVELGWELYKKSRHDVPALECICCVGLIDVENRTYFQNRKFAPCFLSSFFFIL